MYLGIDIGTSSVKSVLINSAQEIVASTTAALTVSKPHEGWSEQAPEDWWAAVVDTIDTLRAQAPNAVAAVQGIGLSGQMHGATILDKQDRPLRPAILWNDVRAAAECDVLERRLPQSQALAGNIAMPGFTAPKIEWLRNHEPDIYDQIAKVLLPKDFIRLELTGEYASDMSDASGTLWLDVGRRDWSDALLANTGLDRSHMPQLVEGTEVSGTLRAELVSRWGMTDVPVVAGGGGDNAASACGVGVVTPGSGFVSLGTSGVLFLSNPRFSPNTAGAVHAFCHALPDTWHQMGVILSATDSLNWLAALTGQAASELGSAVDGAATTPSRELFLPYLSGERTPYNDASARGIFTGLSHLSDPVSLAHAVMDGVAYAFKDSQMVLKEGGASIDTLIAVGGGAKSTYWVQTIATLLDQPISLPEAGDFGGAYGAARLGLCAATNADVSNVCQQPNLTRTFEPDRSVQSAYLEQYGRYRELYRVCKPVLA